jgi:succinate-semialdehyde dehydrogenase/glutarate-semialdehyde dehydrogenase
MATLTSQNPYTGEINKTFETVSNEQLTALIGQAHQTYLSWKNTPVAEKKKLFLRMADLIDERNADYALLETREMGSLWSFSKNVLKGTANLIRRNANNFESVLANESFDAEWLKWHIQYDPIGVIYGIAPWNFPFNQLLRAAVPNILAGNTQLYKHASNVPMCLEAIHQLFVDAGFPIGVFTALYMSASQSEQIISHPAVQWVNITGSEDAWSSIGALAGKHLKRSVLELGGNDAFVVLDHTDTDAIVAQAAACRLSNGGQRCNSSKRFIVLDKHYDIFVEKFGAYMASQKVWDPMDPATQVPPMSSKKLVQDIDKQVQESIAQWARLVTWGTIVDAERNLYAPTLLADMKPDMTSWREEVFGPVASIIKASSVEESIALANASDFGLSAAVYGEDVEQCKQVAMQLDGGMIFINQAPGSKASLPFGGVRKSGYGKENGPDGLKAFTNRKVILY